MAVVIQRKTNRNSYAIYRTVPFKLGLELTPDLKVGEIKRGQLTFLLVTSERGYKTRSSAVAVRPRDASCHWMFC